VVPVRIDATLLAERAERDHVSRSEAIRAALRLLRRVKVDDSHEGTESNGKKRPCRRACRLRSRSGRRLTTAATPKPPRPGRRRGAMARRRLRHGLRTHPVRLFAPGTAAFGASVASDTHPLRSNAPGTAAAGPSKGPSATAPGAFDHHGCVGGAFPPAAATASGGFDHRGCVGQTMAKVLPARRRDPGVDRRSRARGPAAGRPLRVPTAALPRTGPAGPAGGRLGGRCARRPSTACGSGPRGSAPVARRATRGTVSGSR
jgi:Arc/MetJ-type ribon-helix-helix transcriptional regulator